MRSLTCALCLLAGLTLPAAAQGLSASQAQAVHKFRTVVSYFRKQTCGPLLVTEALVCNTQFKVAVAPLIGQIAAAAAQRRTARTKRSAALKVLINAEIDLLAYRLESLRDAYAKK